MNDVSKTIEWCDMTVNPFSGCLHPCPYCYARRFANRHGCNPSSGTYYRLKQSGYDPFTPAFSMSRFLKINDELKRKRDSKVVFVGSMGDIGGMWRFLDGDNLNCCSFSAESVRSKMVDLCLAHQRHQFVFLTKNPGGLLDQHWPDNSLVGVSVTDTVEAMDRIPRLLKVKGGAKCVSIEPLLDLWFKPDFLKGVDWVMVGLQNPVKEVDKEIMLSAQKIVEWCLRMSVPVFVKKNLRQVDVSISWPTQRPGG